MRRRALSRWFRVGPEPVEILPPSGPCDPTVFCHQASPDPALITVAAETGGVLLCGGFIRLLGRSSNRMGRGLAGWNRTYLPRSEHRLPGALLIGEDLGGGFYAVNHGHFPGPLGSVHRLEPVYVLWSLLADDYAGFVRELSSGELDWYFEDDRVEGWRALAAEPTLDRVFDRAARNSRRIVSVSALWDIQTSVELARRLAHPAMDKKLACPGCDRIYLHYVASEGGFSVWTNPKFDFVAEGPTRRLYRVLCPCGYHHKATMPFGGRSS